MKNEILNHQILRELRREPLTSTELADRLNAKENDCRHALYDLADMGKVCKSLFGERWETTSGGYCPEPGPGGAA